MDGTLRSANEEKFNLSTQLTEYKNKIVKLQEELIDSHALLSDLNVQLATQCDTRSSAYQQQQTYGEDDENRVNISNQSAGGGPIYA